MIEIISVVLSVLREKKRPESSHNTSGFIWLHLAMLMRAQEGKTIAMVLVNVLCT